MKEVFQFWGFTRADHLAVVGDARPLQLIPGDQGVASFGRVVLKGELVDMARPVTAGAGPAWWSWIVGLCPGEPEGEALAMLELAGGRSVPLVTRRDGGRYRFHFDLDATVRFIQTEAYVRTAPPLYVRLGVMRLPLGAGVRKFGLRALNQVRRCLPDRDCRFPNDPLDGSIDSWRCLVRELATRAGARPVEPLWPFGKKYAVALTHDIDTAYGFRHPRAIRALAEAEEKVGARSAWMVVGRLLPEGEGMLDELHARGHEIGFHGSEHDHRLAFLSRGEMRRRLSQVEPLRARYGTRGFRSPNYLRSPALFQELRGFISYDMSVPLYSRGVGTLRTTTAGCASCHPFESSARGLLELPNTVPEDVTLELLGHDPQSAVEEQVRVIRGIKARGGMASLITHPEPQLSARPAWTQAYVRLLEELAADREAWFCTPGELHRHWREREARVQQCWEDRPVRNCPVCRQSRQRSVALSA